MQAWLICAWLPVASRVGHLRFTFTDTSVPYVLVEATRASVIGSSNPNNLTYPEGSIVIDPDRLEICGSNPERQDYIIAPISTPATKWSGYFCARFDQPFASWGITQNGSVAQSQTSGAGAMLSAYAAFTPTLARVNVRVAVSFISIDQARQNLEKEIPDGQSLEETARNTRAAWAEKLDRIKLVGATKEQKEIFYTGFFHTLQVGQTIIVLYLCSFMQYPYEQDEYGRYYSGYDDSVHEGISYTGYSIWVCRTHPPFRSNINFHLGYISSGVGMAYPFRSRESSGNGTEHDSRLQGGMQDNDHCSWLLDFSRRVAGSQCGKTSSVRPLRMGPQTYSDHSEQKQISWCVSPS